MRSEVVNTIGILKDLLRINNDRSEGYKRAADETQELDLKTIFLNMGDESKKNTSELAREIKKMGGDTDSMSTSTAGKLFRVWTDIKSTFTGKDKQFILNSCEHGEDASQNAYRNAISSNDLPTEVRQLIRNQQVALRASHDWIRNYR
jgi:uncharacterized protein (TIGR02284 family)